jgi:N-acyl amino acid synthase of PEP-CTERM/exosortase system
VFERIFANTPELIREAHRLRYQVYCIEHAYEDAGKSPAGLERDEYDHHSLHGILRHRPTGTVVGTMRWVMHKAETGARSFPLYGACSDPRVQSKTFFPMERTAELSRFAISKEFRRSLNGEKAEQMRHARAIETAQKLDTGTTVLNLISVALQIAFAHGVEYALAAMEPTLLRLLSRFAIRFEPLGPLVRYHGLRQPCYAHLPSLMERVEAERPELWDVMTECGRIWPSALKDLRLRATPPRIQALLGADQGNSASAEPSALAAVA